MDIRRTLREGLLSQPRIMAADIPTPNNVNVLKNMFTDAGYELYLVGGAVRDFLLGKPIKDYDLATNARPDAIQSLLKKNPDISTKPTGEQFGIINAFIEGEEYEIATFREDSDSGDGRRPDSVVFSDIRTDVNRRDLTINALFYNLDSKEIVDYVGGIEDIENGVVRTVGEPAKRFEEDKLRILRAIRFANRTGNGLDPKIDAFLKGGYDLSDVSKERIRDEFLKSIKSAISVKELMSMYLEYDMFKWILPGFEINTNFIDNDDYIIIMAELLIDTNVNDMGKKLNKLTYTINEIKDIRFLISIVQFLNVGTAYELKRNQANTRVTDVQILFIGSLHGVMGTLLRAFNNYELSVKGGDVMAQYDVKGPEVGRMINKLETEKFKQLL